MFVTVRSALMLCLPGILVACATAPGGSGDLSATDVSLPFKASGNEPGWALTVDNERMTLDWAYGDQHVDVPRPEPTRAGRDLRYRAATEAHNMNVSIRRRICHAASGMPYPYTVGVRIDGEPLQGCGGDTRSLLEDTVWRVERISGRNAIDFTHTTIAFRDDGALTGFAGVLRYRGRYRVTAEKFSVGSIQINRRYRQPALEDEERFFLRALSDARGFDIDASGKLMIRTRSGKTITALPVE